MPNDLGAPKRSDCREGALICSLIAALLAAIAIGLRTGFPDLLATTVLRSLGLSWILIHLPWLFQIASSRAVGRDEDSLRWWNCDSIRTLAALFLVAAVAVAITRIGISLSDVVLPMGGALVAARFAASFLQREDDRSWLRAIALIAFAGFLGIYGASAIWGSGYQNPLFMERLASGAGHIDTLFHAAVSNMIRTQGVPSTGLDGAPFLHYHFGSHGLIAFLCNLIGVSVIDFYNVGYAIVFVPFLLQCLVAFAGDLASCGKEQRTGLGFWFVVCIGIAGFLPLDSGFATPSARTSIFVSESYLIGVAISLPAVAAAVRFFRHQVTDGSRPAAAGWIAGSLIFPTLLAAICLAKLSIMLVLAAAAVYGVLRLKLFRVPGAIVILLLSAAAATVAFRLTYSPGYEEETGLEPFGFLRGNVRSEWWSLYWVVYYGWFWVYLAIRCRQAELRTVADLVQAFRQRSMIDVELLAVVAVAGALPGLILSRWSSTHYFSEYQHWLGLGLVLAALPRRKVEKPAPVVSEREGCCSAVRLTSVAVCAGAIIAAGTMLLNATSLARQMVAVNLESRGFPAGNTGVGLLLMKLRFSEAHETLSRHAAEFAERRKRELKLLDTLRELDRMPLKEKGRTALHIPRESSYWSLFEPGAHSAQAYALIAPALSGLVSINGLYEPSLDDRWMGYGYQTYPRPVSGRSARNPCDRAGEIGFLSVLELRTVDGQSTVAVPLECR